MVIKLIKLKEGRVFAHQDGEGKVRIGFHSENFSLSVYQTVDYSEAEKLAKSIMEFVQNLKKGGAA